MLFIIKITGEKKPIYMFEFMQRWSVLSIHLNDDILKEDFTVIATTFSK
jgi:hypothetical protein